MKTILEIGSSHFLLSSSANINAVVALLTKAVPLDFERIGDHYVYVPSESDGRYGEARVRVLIVEDSKVRERPKRKAIPEQAGPDAHNTFGS